MKWSALNQTRFNVKPRKCTHAVEFTTHHCAVRLECELKSKTLTRLEHGDCRFRAAQAISILYARRKMEGSLEVFGVKKIGPSILVPQNLFKKKFFFSSLQAVLHFDRIVICLFQLKRNIWFLPAV